jgi:membrane protease YdiL (CAAX protease family)
MLSLSMGLAAGFYEETLFRAVAVPLGMRYLKSKNRMYYIVFATALVFGLLHIGNVTNGASASVSVIQGIATIFAGFVFIAVYLRTGNVLIPIFMHSIFDYMCFVTDPTLENGIMTGATVSTGLILALVVEIIAGLWGLWLIRPAMKEKIEALWNEKWSVSR